MARTRPIVIGNGMLGRHFLAQLAEHTPVHGFMVTVIGEG
jgi:NAD(P)H-nitrite reductase large subunit